MSALPPKADIRRVVAECPLMTHNGSLTGTQKLVGTATASAVNDMGERHERKIIAGRDIGPSRPANPTIPLFAFGSLEFKARLP